MPVVADWPIDFPQLEHDITAMNTDARGSR
jgi:hypothetical protein